MKRAMAFMLVVIMALTMFAACGSNNDSNGNQTNDAATATPAADTSNTQNETPVDTATEAPADAEEPTPVQEVDYSENETFTIWEQADTNDYYSEYSDHPAIQYINRMFNVTMKFEHPPVGSESDSLSLMMGTGEYTDMVSMTLYSGSINELYDDGVIIDIAEYLDYMPNLKNWLETDEGFARNMYDDNGHIFRLKQLSSSDELIWGGLVYRRDILEAMTDGTPTFPSGNAEPTTIEDWEYMLPLYKQYFEAAGMTEYAPFILPYTGIFAFGELTNGFGVGHTYYVDNGIVKYGPLEDGFYNYLAKMKEWYDLGYIYKDFASRTNDPVYLPNTALTYGGAAGIWYGLQSQLGEAMSMPDYGLFFNVQPLQAPLDTEHGITEAAPFIRTKYNEPAAAGFAVTTACKNIPKLLSIIDYLYSEEASMLRYGITKEQGADTDEMLIKAGLEEGTYWFDENGQFTYNPLTVFGGGNIDMDPFMNIRFLFYINRDYERELSQEIFKEADNVWGAYPDAKLQKLPGVTVSQDIEKTFIDNGTAISDVQYTFITNFILGTTELNEQTWAEYKDNLNGLGVAQNLEILQAAYERYMNR
jgi:putative aldouronate transport system substrate-binding protein